MSSVSAMFISQPTTASLPFWPLGRERMILILEDTDEQIVARGLDPDRQEIAFTAELRADQLQAFIAAAQQGTAGELQPALVRNENIRRRRPGALEAKTNTVVITGTGPGDGPGPKLGTTYLVVLAAEDSAVFRRRR